MYKARWVGSHFTYVIHRERCEASSPDGRLLLSSGKPTVIGSRVGHLCVGASTFTCRLALHGILSFFS